MNLAGEAVPPVWVLNVERITPAIRKAMRDAFADPCLHMWFNGRWIIPCAVVAGGKKGGVTRNNIRLVMEEMERYMDGDCYVRGSTWEDRIPDEEWQPKSPIYQFTDWHASRTCSEFLMMQVFMKHLIAGYIPNCTPWMQAADAWGFKHLKEQVTPLTQNCKTRENVVPPSSKTLTTGGSNEDLHV